MEGGRNGEEAQVDMVICGRVCLSADASVCLLFTGAGLVLFLCQLKVEPWAPVKRAHQQAVSTLFLFVCVSFVCAESTHTNTHVGRQACGSLGHPGPTHTKDTFSLCSFLTALQKCNKDMNTLTTNSAISPAYFIFSSSFGFSALYLHLSHLLSHCSRILPFSHSSM